MNWVVFSYSLPSKSNSSPRVTLWRRMQRLGAVSPAGGTQVLPAREECVEAFQWLAQEIQQTGGRAFVMHVQQFDGLSDQQLVDLFHSSRAEASIAPKERKYKHGWENMPRLWPPVQLRTPRSRLLRPQTTKTKFG